MRTLLRTALLLGLTYPLIALAGPVARAADTATSTSPQGSGGAATTTAGATPTTAATATTAGTETTAATATSQTPASQPSSDQPAATEGVAPVDVIEVTGLFDRVVIDFVERSLSRAANDGAQLLVIQLNTKGSVVSAERMSRLALRISASPVPVGIWVGPSGARAYGTPGQLLAAAAFTGVSPGSRIGDFGADVPAVATPGATSGAGTALPHLDLSAHPELRDHSVGSADAKAFKLVTSDAPVLGEFIVGLDGVELKGRTLHMARVVERNGQPRREPAAQVRFSKLGLLPRLMHTVASPPVAYLLLVIGLSLVIFEFFTAGVGIAGGVGAVCLVLAAYGLAALPVSIWALVLMGVAMFGFAIDVQTGVPRVWTGIGVVAFVISSLTLFHRFGLSWIPLVVAIGGVLLAFLAGMPAMVRSRFATPTIGREWMIGEMGLAISDLNPGGVVEVGRGRWTARTNRATPIDMDDVVRVVGIEGVTLLVEPETGGAKDYRERSRSRS